MSDETDYIPIPCALHSEYELAIMRRQKLRTRWRGADGVEHVEALLPLDLTTYEHQEFMLAVSDAGEQRRIRLDQILSTDPIEVSRP